MCDLVRARVTAEKDSVLLETAIPEQARENLQGAGIRGGAPDRSFGVPSYAQYLQDMAQQSVAPQQHSVSALLPPRGRGEGGGQRGRAGQASQVHQVTFAAPAQAAKEPPKWAAMAGGNSTNPQLCMNPACVRGAVCWKNHVAK